MTEQQRRAIEILNNLKAGKYDDGTPVINDDDYFLLLSFIVDRQTEIQYVPTVVPHIYPDVIQPYYLQRFDVTCKNE